MFITLLGAATCSLGNVPIDDCRSNAECTSLFGEGSECVDGACTEPGRCTQATECQERLGYGARCVEGICAGGALDPRCRVVGPEPVVAALGTGKPTKEAVVLGAVFDLTPEKEQARAAAVELAVEDMNAQGGTRPLAVVVCNAASSDGLNAPVDLARYLARDVGVPAIVGPSTTQAVGNVATALYGAEALARVVVTPSATGLQLSDQPDSVDGSAGLLYRTCVADGVQATRLATEMDAMPTGAFVILYQNDQYGQSYEQVLRAALGGRDVTSIYFDGVTTGATVPEVVAQAAAVTDVAGIAIVSNRVDLTVSILSEASNAPALAMARWFLTDGSKDKTLATSGLGSILGQVVGVAQRDPSNPTFFGRLKQKTGFDPAQYSFVSNAYDAAFVIGFGVAYADATAGKVDGPAVAEAMTRLSDGAAVAVGTVEFKKGISALAAEGRIDVVGISGPLDFDEKGDVAGTQADVALWCVSGGAIVACP